MSISTSLGSICENVYTVGSGFLIVTAIEFFSLGLEVLLCRSKNPPSHRTFMNSLAFVPLFFLGYPYKCNVYVLKWHLLSVFVKEEDHRRSGPALSTLKGNDGRWKGKALETQPLVLTRLRL